MRTKAQPKLEPGKNMSYVCALIMGYSDGIPEKAGKSEMIMLNTGLERYEDSFIIPPESCSYLTTFAHKTDDIDMALSEIRETWIEWTQQEITLEVLTTDKSSMTRDQKRTFDELGDGEWSYRLPLVAFCRNNKAALGEAKTFIIECSIKKKWKFWQ